MSRSSSWMNQSDCHDFRVYFGEFAYVSLEKILQGLETHEVRVKETVDEVISRNTAEKKNQHQTAREQAMDQVERFMPMFKKFYLNALSVIVTFEKKLKTLIMHQVVSFNKMQRLDIHDIYTEKIKALQDLAVLICEA